MTISNLILKLVQSLEVTKHGIRGRLPTEMESCRHIDAGSSTNCLRMKQFEKESKEPTQSKNSAIFKYTCYLKQPLTFVFPYNTLRKLL